MFPDLQKLRRFALAIGLVLITYSVAAVELDVEGVVRPLGVPLKINQPGLLGLGLALASLYSLVRFWHYGTMAQMTPSKQRWSSLNRAGIGRRFGATKELYVSEPEREEFVENFRPLFPQVPGVLISAKWRLDSTRPDESLDFNPTYMLECLIVPRRIRFVTALEQIDYLAPIWVNAVALLLWGWRVVH